MAETTQAYPLAWPPGWRRIPSHQRTRARFNVKKSETRTWADGTHYTRTSSQQLSVSEALNRVLEELEQLGVVNRGDIVISSNLVVRLDGYPRSGQREPDDPGVAVYWKRPGEKPRCMAVDRYDRAADNLAAIAATLEAMRAIERHGGATILDRAFTGFTALPAPEQWFMILGVRAVATRSEIEDAYRRLAMKHHPDRGGSADQMARINQARDDGLAQNG